MSDSDVVIRVEGLGKKYALHHEKSERYTALRDVVARQASAAGRLLNPFTLAGQLRKAQREAAAERAESEEEFWALKDVSFEIRRGERVGIIGRNGAGKSTLLKVLSRITEPTTGRVEIRGRVASLLEVGTGFHPELTGRENIYLNGAILGMTRREIRSKFDEIVDFAEVEKFLDTPVKRYSSGMYVRLAFAVAAHLEPEILVVDEVLAVGDARFQKKCLNRLSGLSKDHKTTVIFVSHQIAYLAGLCNTGLLFESGVVIANDTINRVIDIYMQPSDEGSTFSPKGLEGVVMIETLKIYQDQCPSQPNTMPESINATKPLFISLSLSGDPGIFKASRNILSLISSTQETAFAFTDHDLHRNSLKAYSRYCLNVVIPANILNRGSYTLAWSSGIYGIRRLVDNVVLAQFNVDIAGYSGTSLAEPWPGACLPPVSIMLSDVDPATHA